MSSVVSMSTADQRQSGQQQWLEEYEELYSNFLMSVANTALLLTKHRAYLEEQLLTSSNPRDDNGPTDGSIEPTASTLAPRAQQWQSYSPSSDSTRRGHVHFEEL